MRRALTALLLPEGLILLAAAAAVRWPDILAPVGPLLPWVPALVFATGIGLALRFQRSAVLFGLLALGGTGAALAWAAGARATGTPPGVLEPMLGLLLPLNLAAFALLPERGVASGAAGRRLAALAAQAALLLVLARPEQSPLWIPLTYRPLTGGLLPRDAPLGDLALLLFGAAILVLAVLVLRSRAPLMRGFLWAHGMSLLALAASPARLPGGIPAAAIFLTAAGLALVVALVEAAHALAFRDALTGLASRRALDDTLHRIEGPFAFAMVDVDHFKSVNDTYGHDVGDQVLRMVASRLEEVGEGGRAFRYGGEEFAILFPGRQAGQVLETLDAVREAVSRTRFTLRAADRPRRRPKRPRRRRDAAHLTVTVSMGVAQRGPAEAVAEAAVKRADAALYRAKQAGRNRIETGKTGGRD